MGLLEIGILVAAGLIIVGIFYLSRESKNLNLNEDSVREKTQFGDLNKDGKINSEDVKVAVQNVVRSVKKVADVNKDGEVNLDDAKAAVTAVAAKAKSVVKKVATKKTTAKPKTAGKNTRKS